MTPQERNFLILLHAFANVVTDREGEVADFDSADFLTAAHPLLTYISTLESELQQVKVERDGLREAIGRIARHSEPRRRTAGIPAKDLRCINDLANAALAPAPAARTEG